MPLNLLLEKCGHLTKFSEIFTIQPGLPNQPAFWAAYENYGLLYSALVIVAHQGITTMDMGERHKK